MCPGPYGGTLLYVAPRWIEEGVALEEHEHFRASASGSTELLFQYGPEGADGRADPVGYSTEYAAGALRFGSGGRPNPVLLPMLKVRCTKTVHVCERERERVRTHHQ